MPSVIEKPKAFASASVEPVAPICLEAERLRRKQRLAATFRIFARYGFDLGIAGHVTARDPEFPDRFWINPLAKYFGNIKVSDLHLVDREGNVLIGDNEINRAGFCIHAAIHAARPDVVAAAHTHSTYGKAWSALGRLLDPITQDSCVFYQDHALLEPFSGVVLLDAEGRRLAETLGHKKALILQNHGLLTVGRTVEAAAWWFIAMENAAHTQLLAEAAGAVKLVASEVAELTASQIGTHERGLLNFQSLWEWIVVAEPDLLD
jgi:ribulose-5-phosphate 4-epimerase/fuculose-1-phosphate aldolase